MSAPQARSGTSAAAQRLTAVINAVAGPDVSEEFGLFRGHELHVVRGGSTLTFEHTYDRKGTRVRVYAYPGLQ
eukprot:1146910-Pelagomonas_calceolata.AAC.2